MTHEIIHGDCLEEMRKMADNSISAIVTDCPYAISFMSKEWDRNLPSIEYWREMLRIVKPGGHLLAAGLPRMMHRLISVIEDSGWQIRDLLMHLFGSGFPKSHNHFGIDGYGTALKPAWEGWSLAMKPLDGTFAQNAEKWGQAGINIDGCRIPTSDSYSYPKGPKGNGFHGGVGREPDQSRLDSVESNPQGRWPSNLILDEESGRLLDEMTIYLHSAGKARNAVRQCEDTGIFGLPGDGHRIGDTGGASRFFYCAKASSRERNEGLPEGQRSTHPTVKPLRLMEYLIRLVMPPKDGILLDPFAGSGTTILAAKRLGFSAIGIEKQAEYVEIARARVAYKDLFT